MVYHDTSFSVLLRDLRWNLGHRQIRDSHRQIIVIRWNPVCGENSANIWGVPMLLTLG